MIPINYYEIGQKIKQCRLEQGISQEQMAEKCGISSSFYGNIERGTRKMSLETFVSISKALDVSADYLLSGELPDSDPVIGHIISEAKKAGALQYERYLRILKALAKIVDEI